MTIRPHASARSLSGQETAAGSAPPPADPGGPAPPVDSGAPTPPAAPAPQMDVFVASAGEPRGWQAPAPASPRPPTGPAVGARPSVGELVECCTQVQLAAHRLAAGPAQPADLDDARILAADVRDLLGDVQAWLRRPEDAGSDDAAAAAVGAGDGTSPQSQAPAGRADAEVGLADTLSRLLALTGQLDAEVDRADRALADWARHAPCRVVDLDAYMG